MSMDFNEEREFIIDAVTRAKVPTVHPSAANTVDIGRAVLAAYRAALPAQAEQAAAVRAAEWVSVMDRLPANQEAVLVMSDSWSRPAVLVYSDRPYQRFMDRRAGQWFWYPERMHWMPLPQAPGNRTQSTGQTSNDTGALGDTGGTE
jgi:hypothetical protein